MMFDEKKYKNKFNKENYTKYCFRIKKDLAAKFEKALLDRNVKKIEVFRESIENFLKEK